jgi:predicted nucleotidyltransferase
MTVDEVRAALAGHWDELTELGVGSLSIFGSTARGEAGPESDVDLLVEVNRRMGMFEFIDIKLRLEELLGREVDLVMPDALKPRVRNEVLKEAVRAA